MLRNLTAIEIAEGALLADIAVIFQLISVYTPVGTSFFRMPIFIVFTVLVLRRGFYVGVMAACIAVFLVAVLVGATGVPFMCLVVAGGLFLGLTIRWRLPHVLLVLIGTTCGALAFYCVLLLFTVLAGQSPNDFIHWFVTTYHAALVIIGAVTLRLGLAGWWRHTLYPPVNLLFNFFVTYWLLALYVCCWLLMCPVVTAIYIATHSTVKLLGYNVRPLMGRKANKALRRVSHRFLKLKMRKQTAH